MSRWDPIMVLWTLLNVWGIRGSALAQAPEFLRDARGRLVSIAKPPQRIASSFVGADEIMLELLSQDGRTDRLIAVSTLADDPTYSSIWDQAQRIAGRVGTDLEALARQKPDLVVLANFNRPEMVLQLDHLGIPTFVLGGFGSISDIKANIVTIGQLIHTESAAAKLAREVENGCKVHPLILKPDHFPSVISWSADGFVMGRKTIFDDIIVAAGGTNLAASRLEIEGWAKVSPEILATLSPEWIIATGNETDQKNIFGRIRSDRVWGQMEAAKSGRIIMIPSRLASSTSHHVVEAIKILSAALSSAHSSGDRP